MGSNAKGGAVAARHKGRSSPAKIREDLERLGDGLYEVYEKLSRFIADRRNDEVIFWWNVGKEFKGAHVKFQRNGVVAVAKRLALNDGDVRTAMRLIEAYPTKAALLEVMSQVNGEGRPLTWSHLRLLVSVDLDGKRDELIKKVLAKSWTHEELIRYLQGTLGRRREGGRPRVPLRSLSQAALKWQSLNRNYIDTLRDVYTEEAFETLLESLSPETATPAVLGEIDSLDEQLGTIADLAESQRAQLAAVKARVEGKLSGEAAPAAAPRPSSPRASAQEKARQAMALVRQKKRRSAAAR